MDANVQENVKELTYIKVCFGIPAKISNVPKREGEGECKSIQVEREGVRKYRERERERREGERESVSKFVNQYRERERGHQRETLQN